MCHARWPAPRPEQKHSRERRDLQFRAPRFYELVVISVTTTFPAIHIEPDRLESLRRRRRLLFVIEIAPNAQQVRQSYTGRKVLDATKLSHELFVTGMNRREFKTLITD